MAYMGAVRRWDVFWADLNNVVGHEQGGERRPVIVVSNDDYNVQQRFTVYTVVPATKLEGKNRQVYPFEVVLPKGAITAEYASIVMPQQVRSIDKVRLLERIGRIEKETWREQIEDQLLLHMDLSAPEEEAEAAATPTSQAQQSPPLSGGASTSTDPQ